MQEVNNSLQIRFCVCNSFFHLRAVYRRLFSKSTSLHLRISVRHRKIYERVINPGLVFDFVVRTYNCACVCTPKYAFNVNLQVEK